MLSFLVSFAILGGVGATAVATHKHHPTNILPLPTVDGPIVGGTKGHPFSAFAGNITSLGYVEEEYFLTGYGNRYNVIGNLTQDGLWKLSYNSTAPYKTRVLVRRPIDRKNFNGDVVIEWINVSAGFDITSADTPGIYKNGYIWAGISAQTVGVNGQSPNPQGLVQWDPARYGTLNIPDDAISYDIATAAGRIFRTGKISSGWIPEKVILTGGSQSGTRVLGYVNGVQNLNATFDSVIPVICAGFAADYSSIPAHPNVTNINAHSRAIPTIVRKDINAPIFMLNSETEALAYAEAGNRQDPSSTFREWEITGGSHANLGAEIFLEGQRKLDGFPVALPNNTNISAVNWQPSLDAIYRQVTLWVRDKHYSPPVFPHMEVKLNGTASDYVRDANGNVKGGIRLPEITVPIAAYSGNNNGLSGNTYPFSSAKLYALYPTHEDYVSKVTAAAKLAFDRKVILDYQVTNYINAAKNANIPPMAAFL